jgi:hypothetical protein
MVAMPDPNPTRRRWYQFSISNILWATFWIAILFAAWVSPQTAPEHLNEFQLFLGDVTRSVPLLIAIGALFNRARLGAIIGIAIVAVIYVFADLTGA